MKLQAQQKKPLRSYFPNFSTGAIFSTMADAPWISDGSQIEMDIAYFDMWSGDKPATKFVERLSTDGVADVAKISLILWKMYGKSWSKLWDAYNLQYVPIDNYSILETVSRNQTNDKTKDVNGSVNSTTSSTGKSTSTDDEATTVQYGKVDTLDGKTDTYAYGFNSENQVPTTVSIENNTNTQSGSDTTTRNGTATDETESKASSGTVTGEKEVEKGAEDETITRNREGNVGQNSYQDLIRQELELRRWNFFRQVFSDCDRFLVLSIYDPCLINSVN